MDLNNDLNQPFLLFNGINDNNVNIHERLVEIDDQTEGTLKDKLKFLSNTILFRIPLLYFCDKFYANTAYFNNIFENLNIFDSFCLYLISKLFMLIGKLFI
jgi:hypothetical protein